MNKMGIKWLYRELPELIVRGVVTQEAADKLRQYYGEVKSISKTTVMLIILGNHRSSFNRPGDNPFACPQLGATFTVYPSCPFFGPFSHRTSLGVMGFVEKAAIRSVQRRLGNFFEPYGRSLNSLNQSDL